MIMRLTTVALNFLLGSGTMVTATIRYPEDSDGRSSNLRGVRSSSSSFVSQNNGSGGENDDHAIDQDAEQEVTAPQHQLTIEEQELLLAADEATENYYLQGIRSEPLLPQHYQSIVSQHVHAALSPQNQTQSQDTTSPSSSSNNNNSKIRHKSLSKSKTQTNTALQTFAKNMLTNQGCPPTSHSTCGDICYVLTPTAATDLHSVATGQSTHPTHHWHNPSTFWSTGVCNAKSQCVSVNPFDKTHDFYDLERTLEEVERECERRVGMGTLFVLAKAMEPPAWLVRDDDERSVED